MIGADRELSNPDVIEPWRDVASTGPETLNGKFLRRFWHPIHRIDDVAPGRAVPITRFSEQFTLYRGEGGAPHLVAFRCAHRGTQLSTGWVEGDEIRCFYHGWKYGPDGQCTEQPAEPEPFCSRIKIRSYPVREYLGFVWAYLGEGEPPPFRRFPELEGEGVLEVQPLQIWPCSYFNRLENAVDEVHIPFVHRDSWYTDNLVGIPQMTAEETDYGLVRLGHREDGSVRETYYLMPNILLRTAQPGDPDFHGQWRVAMNIRVPIDDEHFTSFDLFFTALKGTEADEYRRRMETRRANMRNQTAIGAAVLAGEMDKEDMAGLIGAQDYVACVGQGVIPDRESYRLGRSDAPYALLTQIWSRELRALAEGRPLKRWTRPESLIPRSGYEDRQAQAVR